MSGLPHAADAAYKLLRRGTIGAFLVFGGGAALGLFVNLVIARFLGATQYGDYALTITWVNVLAVVALLGQDSCVVRFLPAYIYHQDWGRAHGLRRAAALMVLAASLVLALTGGLLVFVGRLSLGLKLKVSLLIGFLLLPALAELLLSGALHRGLKRAVSANVYSSVLRQIVLLLTVIALWLVLPKSFDAPRAVIAYAVAVVIAMLLSTWFLRRAWPGAAKAAQPVFEFSVWSCVGLQLFMLGVIGIILNRVDVLLLGGLSGSRAVGPYYAAVQLADMVLYGLAAVNTLLAPMIAEYYSAERHEDLARLLRRGAWLIFGISFTAAIILAVCGIWILDLFGPRFSSAYVPMLIIVLGQCVNATAGPTGYLLSMTRFERQALYIYGGGAGLNILLSIVLIPHFGMLGAATATASATVIWNLAALVFIRRHLHINPTIFSLAKT